MHRGQVPRADPAPAPSADPIPSTVRDLVIEALATQDVEYYERTDGSICIEVDIEGETREFTLRISES